MQPITVRRMGFEFPEDIDPIFIPGEPEASYSVIGLSLLLPYLEPYLIRTMREAKKQLSDPELIDGLERFCAQEGQHFREHMRFNQVIRSKGFPGLEPLERALEQDYLRFTEKKPLRFNLAYAEGFEALTTAAAYCSVVAGGAPGMHPAVADLLAWHATEELEHRTVAFDVYYHVVGSYPYRLIYGTYGQWHLVHFIRRVVKYMLAADPQAVARARGERKARDQAERSQELRMLRRMALRTYLPWYTPHDIELTPEMRQMSERYTAMAKSTS